MLKSHKPPKTTARESNFQAPSCTKRILSYGFSQEDSRKKLPGRKKYTCDQIEHQLQAQSPNQYSSTIG
jgi:hypothetical protein